jgi:BASS family bile acid:Na+ symporter
MIELLKFTIIIFIVGSVLQLGLEMSLRNAISGLRNFRFVSYTILFGFLAGPLLSVVLALALRLEEPYAQGLVLLGMTPTAPYLPMMVSRARADPGYVPAILLVSACLTIVVLPLVLPYLISNAAIDFITIARPLALLILPPLAIGMAIFRTAPEVARIMRKIVKPIVSVSTLVMLCLCAVVYGRGFIEAAGSLAVVSQILLLAGIAFAALSFSARLEPDQKSVLVLAMCTRNVGAALAPLYSIAEVDDRLTVMIVLSVPAQLVVVFVVAGWFARKQKAADRIQTGR